MSAERDLGEFERFYHLPVVSTKAAVYHHMRAQRDGFNTTVILELQELSIELS